MKIIGVGGAGCRAVVRMIKHGRPAEVCLLIGMEAQWLKQQSHCDSLILGEHPRVRPFCRTSPAWAKEVATQEEERISQRIGEAGPVLITVGLGGGFGTGAAPVIARVCRALGVRVVTIASLPFPFEGEKRYSTAQKGAEELQAASDLSIQIPYAKLVTTLPATMTLRDAYRQADEMFRLTVEDILATRITDISG